MSLKLKTDEFFCINCNQLLKLNPREKMGEEDIFCPLCSHSFTLDDGINFINNISERERGYCPCCGANLVFDLKDRMPGNTILCPVCNEGFSINKSDKTKNKGNFSSSLAVNSLGVSLLDSVVIPEPTRSLLWITDEDPSLAESPMTINFMISVNPDGEVDSKIKEKGFYAEPSLIWAKLPIMENNNLETEAMYWPRYAAFDPEHRYQYLNWLRDITKPTNLSYVFLYFYGLERHMLIGDYDRAVDEIIRLMKYHNKGSFISYATTSLIVASIARKRLDIIERAPFLLEEEVDEALALRIMLGSPLKGEDVISLASRVGFKNRRYIKLYPKLFEKTLDDKIIEFEKENGPILKFFNLNNFKMEQKSVFANLSIPEEYRMVKIPKIVNDKKFKLAMFNMLQTTHDSIKKSLHTNSKTNISKRSSL